MNRDVSGLALGPFDLLVIGGGIYGASAARDAALRGWSVALVEREDWAAGTSSASSKLVHGGLRYLEHGWFPLVRTALAERELLHRLGPHRVQPVRFVLPVDRSGMRSALKLRAGLALYDALRPRRSSFPGHRRLKTGEVEAACPYLSERELAGGLEFSDAVTDDARLTLETVAGAIRAGAVAANHAEAVGLLAAGDTVEGALVEDRRSGGRLEVRARVTLSAPGPWLDERPFRRVEEPQRLRLTKGVHLLLPALPGVRAVLSTSRSDGRPVFLVPWLGRTLVGTTDTDFRGRPGEERVDAADVAYLLTEAQRFFRRRLWTESDIAGSFAGLRALPAETGVEPGALSREWGLHRSRPGLLLSLGGKLSSARADAVRAVERVASLLGRAAGPAPSAAQPLAWAPREPFLEWLDGVVAAGQRLGLDADCARTAALRHGTNVTQLHDLLAGDSVLASRIAQDVPLCLGEVVHAARHEMAGSAEDILRRRVPVAILAGNDERALAAAKRVAERELAGAPELDSRERRPGSR